MKKIYTLLALFFSLLGGSAMAQTEDVADTPQPINSAEELTTGYYVLDVITDNISGGHVVYSESYESGKRFRVVNNSLAEALADVSYCWKVTRADDGTFTLRHVATGVYMSYEGSVANKNNNLVNPTGDNRGEFALTQLENEGGVPRFGIYETTNPVNDANRYLHTNAGDESSRVCSYYHSISNGGTCERVAFYPVAAPMLDVTYTFTLGGRTLGTKTFAETMGEAPEAAATLPFYVTAQGFPEVVTTQDAYTIETAYADNVPFRVSEGDDETFYMVKFFVNSMNYWWYAGAANGLGKEDKTLTNYVLATADDYNWKVVGDWLNGFRLQTRSGKYIAAPSTGVSVTDVVNVQAEIVDKPTDLTLFDLATFSSGSNWRFRLKTNALDIYLAHTSDGSLPISLYRDVNRPDYAGGAVYFEEVPDYADEIDAAAAWLDYTGLGYPRAEAEARTALAEGLANRDNLNRSTLTTLLNNFSACTDVVMPEDGKAYTFCNVDDSGAKKYFCLSDAGLTLSTNAEDKTVFVCHLIEAAGGDLTCNKYLFVDGEGRYLAWKGNNDGVNGNKGFVPAYAYTSGSNSDWATVEVYKMLVDRLNSNGRKAGLTNESLLGYMYMKARRSASQIGTFISGTNATSFANSNDPFYNTNNSSAIVIEEAGYACNNVRMQHPKVQNPGEGDYNYATMYLPFATTVPEGVEVFTATREDSRLKLEPVEGVVPAGEAVVVRCEGSDEAVTKCFVPSTEAPAKNADNVLQGTMATDEQTPAGTYVLSGAFDSGVGFYAYTAAVLPAGKAYYVTEVAPVLTTNGVRGLLFGNDGGEVTGVAPVAPAAGGLDDVPCYDLGGRRVDHPAKGIYIRAGKKIIIK